MTLTQDSAAPKRGHISVPAEESIVELVKHGMTLSLDAERTSKQIGLSVDTYQYIRKLLMIRGFSYVTEEERELIDKGLRLVDDTRRLARTRDITHSLVSKYWQRKTRSGVAIKLGESRRKRIGKREQNRRQRRLEKTLFIVEEACNNENMALPQLSNEERGEAVASLTRSIRSLCELFARITTGGVSE